VFVALYVGHTGGDYWVIAASGVSAFRSVSSRWATRRDLRVEDAEITCLGCVPERGSSVRVKRPESQPLRVAGHDGPYFGPPRDRS
jgi:hypothetical protein